MQDSDWLLSRRVPRLIDTITVEGHNLKIEPNSRYIYRKVYVGVREEDHFIHIVFVRSPSMDFSAERLPVHVPPCFGPS